MNTHDLPLVYSTLDVSPFELGCIMLDVTPIDISLHLNPGWRDALYTSRSPALPHVAGAVAKEGAHLTLLYGLLDGVQRAHVDQVLVGWQPPKSVTVADIAVFPSPLPETEPYSCIVALIDVDGALADAHARLSLLPHIDTHPTYRPHVTLAYVNRRSEREFVSLLGQGLRGVELNTAGLNYGDRIGGDR